MKLYEVMSKNVRTIDEDATLTEAAKTMFDANVGMLPVIGEKGYPTGVITDRDLAMHSLAEGLSPNSQVRRAMSRSLYEVNEEQDIQVALDLMREKRVGRVLVTDRHGLLVGVISLNDAAILCHGDGRTATVSEALRTRVTHGKLQEARLI